MAKVARIRGGGGSFRRHFLAEWLEERQMEPMDLVHALNDAATMDSPIIDKSQIYRWLGGQLPHRPTQMRIAAVLNLRNDEGDPDPELLMSHPAQTWIARKLKNRPKEEVDRIRQMIDLALPDRTGTEG